MKSKQLKDKAIIQNGRSNWYVFTEEEMAIFWSQLCKEQRAICAKEHLLEISKGGGMSASKIQNAPEPEIE